MEKGELGFEWKVSLSVGEKKVHCRVAGAEISGRAGPRIVWETSRSQREKRQSLSDCDLHWNLCISFSDRFDLIFDLVLRDLCAKKSFAWLLCVIRRVTNRRLFSCQDQPATNRLDSPLSLTSINFYPLSLHLLRTPLSLITLWTNLSSAYCLLRSPLFTLFLPPLQTDISQLPDTFPATLFQTNGRTI